MRFKAKHENGEVKRITKFLWFPKRIRGETRWLEEATWEKTWYQSSDIGWWYGDKWVDE